MLYQRDLDKSIGQVDLVGEIMSAARQAKRLNQSVYLVAGLHTKGFWTVSVSTDSPEPRFNNNALAGLFWGYDWHIIDGKDYSNPANQLLIAGNLLAGVREYVSPAIWNRHYHGTMQFQD